MPISEDIRAAIDKNLSAELGTSLKTRLQYADEDAAEVKRLGLKNTELVLHVAELEKQLSKLSAIDKMIGELHDQEERTRKATTDKAIIDLKEQHAKEKVDILHDVVRAVFANSRFKYQVMETGMVPIATGSPPFPTSQGFSRSSIGEGEGVPPPPPGGSPGHGG